MIKLVRLLLALVGVIVIVMLAVDNRGIVEVIFWPLPFQFRMPLYAVFLAGLVLGPRTGPAQDPVPGAGGTARLTGPCCA